MWQCYIKPRNGVTHAVRKESFMRYSNNIRLVARSGTCIGPVTCRGPGAGSARKFCRDPGTVRVQEYCRGPSPPFGKEENGG